MSLSNGLLPIIAAAAAPPDAQALRDVALGAYTIPDDDPTPTPLLALVKLVKAIRSGVPIKVAEALDYADRAIAGQP